MRPIAAQLKQRLLLQLTLPVGLGRLTLPVGLWNTDHLSLVGKSPIIGGGTRQQLLNLVVNIAKRFQEFLCKKRKNEDGGEDGGEGEDEGEDGGEYEGEDGEDEDGEYEGEDGGEYEGEDGEDECGEDEDGEDGEGEDEGDKYITVLVIDNIE